MAMVMPPLNWAVQIVMMKTLYSIQWHSTMLVMTFDQNCDGVDGVDADQDGYASVESLWNRL